MLGVYDFDGVLACPIEDTVFRLPVSDMDKAFNRMGKDRYNVGRLCESVTRLRHMVLQEVLYERGISAKPGPTFEKLSKSDPFYVLTARSSSGAVARVSEFFENENHRPEELFFVGPMSKTYILASLCASFPEEKLVFYDDTYHHVEAAKELNIPNLEVVWIDNNVEALHSEARAFYTEQFEWLKSVQPSRT